MYIGIDLEVIYTVKGHGKHYRTASLLKQSREITGKIRELQQLDPRDYIEGQLIHKPTSVDVFVATRDEMIEQLYKYIFYKPG